jgi:hypothetical protein
VRCAPEHCSGDLSQLFSSLAWFSPFSLPSREVDTTRSPSGRGVDISEGAGHPEEVQPPLSPDSRSHSKWWLWVSALSLSTAIVASLPALAPVASAQGVKHAKSSSSSKHGKKRPKGKSQQTGNHPCLEGHWNVTSLTLSTSGLSFTGGAGTTVYIMSNGNALGNFTPGTPLTGTEGSAKFNGTITDHYGFSSKTTAHSGAFPVTNVSDNATITVAGVTKAVAPSPEQGSYTCNGKDLTLTFTSGASTLTYQLALAS